MGQTLEAPSLPVGVSPLPSMRQGRRVDAWGMTVAVAGRFGCVESWNLYRGYWGYCRVFWGAGGGCLLGMLWIEAEPIEGGVPSHPFHRVPS